MAWKVSFLIGSLITVLALSGMTVLWQAGASAQEENELLRPPMPELSVQLAWLPRYRSLVRRLDAQLLPLAERLAVKVDGFLRRQILMIDISSNRFYHTLLRNLFHSLKNLQMAEHTLVLGISFVSDADQCAPLRNVSRNCLDLSWFARESLLLNPPLMADPRKIQGGSERFMRGFLIVRLTVLWRLLRLGFGVVMLDSDISFPRNGPPLFGLGQENYDFVYAVDYGPCGTYWHQLPLSGSTTLCGTPIPPYFVQPYAAPLFEKWLVGFIDYPLRENMLPALFQYLRGMQKVGESPNLIEYRLSPDLRLAQLRCNVCMSACNRPGGNIPLGICEPLRGQSVLSVHANCKTSFFDRKQSLEAHGVWYLDN